MWDSTEHAVQWSSIPLATGTVQNTMSYTLFNSECDIAICLQMILLYQDPKGELVGTTLRMTTNANVTQTGSGPTVREKVNPSELESKVASLEKLVTELRNENEALKVSIHA